MFMFIYLVFTINHSFNKKFKMTQKRGEMNTISDNSDIGGC
jgi:hypothetical protein